MDSANPYSVCAPYEAFMRVNKDLKGDRIDELKARYGIDLDKN